MIESILPDLNLEDFIEIFILMSVSFLIGYTFAYYYFKYKFEKNKSTFRIQDYNDDLDTTPGGGIKATKTFERGGLEVEEKPQDDIELFVEDKKEIKDNSKSS